MNRTKTLHKEIVKTNQNETGHLEDNPKNNTAPLRSQIPRNKIYERQRKNKKIQITKFQTRISTDEGNRNTTQARIKTEVVNSNCERNKNISGATIIKKKGHTLLVLPPI